MTLGERARACASKTLEGKVLVRCEHDRASHAFLVVNTGTGLPENGDCLVSGCPCKGYVDPDSLKGKKA